MAGADHPDLDSDWWDSSDSGTGDSRPGFGIRPEKRTAHDRRSLCLYAESALFGLARLGRRFCRCGAKLVDYWRHASHIHRHLSAGDSRRGGLSRPALPRVRGLCLPSTTPLSALQYPWESGRRIFLGVVSQASRVQCDIRYHFHAGNLSVEVALVVELTFTWLCERCRWNLAEALIRSCVFLGFLLQPEPFVHEPLQARLIEDIVGELLIRKHGERGAFRIGYHLRSFFHGQTRVLADD